jgi:hypothetical protein
MAKIRISLRYILVRVCGPVVGEPLPFLLVWGVVGAHTLDERDELVIVMTASKSSCFPE